MTTIVLPIAVPLIVAFTASVVLTWTVRAMARRLGFLDHPNDSHKRHAEATPLGGGIALFASTSITILFVLLVFGVPQGGSPLNVNELIALFVATSLVCAIGLYDDRFSLRGRQKLAGQFLAVCVVISAGVVVRNVHIFSWHLDLGLLTFPFTAFWLLGTINAFNLLDGSDGCAATIGAVISATLTVTAALLGHWQEAIVAAALTGALLGFLLFNLPPSSIFLGDAGSLLLGMVLGVLAIQGHLKGPATVALAAPLALLAIPIMDCAAAVLRRWLTGRKIALGDRAHLHHVLRRLGYSPGQIVLCLFFLSGLSALGALASVVFQNHIFAFGSVALVVTIMWANDLFGTRELQLLRMRLSRFIGSLIPEPFRRNVTHQSRIGLTGSRACRRLWTELTRFAQKRNLSHVRLDLMRGGADGDTVFWERRDRNEATKNWQLRIPLAVDDIPLGELEIGGSISNGHGHKILTPLSELVDSLRPDLEQMVRESQSRNSNGQTIDRSLTHAGGFLTFDRADIAGIKFDFMLGADVITAVQYWRHARQRSYITLTNPYSVMLCRRDVAMRDATVGADLTLPDGVGVLLAAKLLGYGRRHRVSGPSLMLRLCDAGRQFGYRHFFYGGAEGIAEQLAERLSARFPGLTVAGTYCPPFHALTREEDDQVVEAINSSQPDIVWVGLGAPKQEKWMAEHAICIDATTMIGVGAAFDFHTGNVKWAPWIVRKCGMEWAYRLAMEPRRMWRRNLDSPVFMALVTLQLAKRLSRNLFGRSAAPRLRSVSWCVDRPYKQAVAAPQASKTGGIST